MKQFAPLLVAVFLMVLSPASVLAGKIGHHGLTVEADSSANACLSCHDGTIGHNVLFCTVKCDFKSPHSILKPYPPRGKEREYASAASIQAQGLRLENGRVTCISCHDLRNSRKGHPVKVSRDRGLCSICHIKM